MKCQARSAKIEDELVGGEVDRCGDLQHNATLACGRPEARGRPGTRDGVWRRTRGEVVMSLR